MNFIVVGCGRVGSELAFRLFQSGHQIVVVDSNKESFKRLHPDFRGRTVEGEALSEKVLERAGITEADGLAAVTNLDALNAVVAHTAQAVYNVPNVVARNYDPQLRPMIEAFGVHMVSSTSWGAQRVEELLTDLSLRTVFSAGNGEVEVYETVITESWDGRSLVELLGPSRDCLPVALTRAGRASLPTLESILKTGDVLNVSTTFAGISALRARLSNGSEA
jgi:trk system potassium uptake protein TrkA